MVPEILKLCRVYYENDYFRHNLEKWFSDMTSNLQEPKEGLFIDHVTMYAEGTDRLCDGSDPSAVVAIDYSIRRKGEMYPICGDTILNVHKGG